MLYRDSWEYKSTYINLAFIISNWIDFQWIESLNSCQWIVWILSVGFDTNSIEYFIWLHLQSLLQIKEQKHSLDCTQKVLKLDIMAKVLVLLAFNNEDKFVRKCSHEQNAMFNYRSYFLAYVIALYCGNQSNIFPKSSLSW